MRNRAAGVLVGSNRGFVAPRWGIARNAALVQSARRRRRVRFGAWVWSVRGRLPEDRGVYPGLRCRRDFDDGSVAGRVKPTLGLLAAMDLTETTALVPVRGIDHAPSAAERFLAAAVVRCSGLNDRLAPAAVNPRPSSGTQGQKTGMVRSSSAAPTPVAHAACSHSQSPGQRPLP
jgi:hypothetical protein